MTTWTYQKELEHAATQKAYHEAQAKYDPMEKARTEALKRLGKMMNDMPHDSLTNIGLWMIQNAPVIINEIGQFYPLTARMERVERDLRLAAETLRAYEAHHRAKARKPGIESAEMADAHNKAERNRELAERFEATLGIKPQEKQQ